MKVLEGKLVATKGKFAIVGARFNEFIVSKLISGAEDTLVRHGVDTDDITLVWVPGAFEIQHAARPATTTSCATKPPRASHRSTCRPAYR